MRENYNPSRGTHFPLHNPPRKTSLERQEGHSSPSRGQEPSDGLLKKFELPRENIMQAVSIVEWRCQTSLPILRVAHYEVSPLPHPGQQKPTFFPPSPSKYSLLFSSLTHKSSAKITQFVQGHPEVPAYELRVRAEAVRWRLSEVGAMPFSQALHLLREMLIGFEALFDIFGAFQPKEELVAVNSADQWRMWIDEDFCSSLKNQTTITEKEFIYLVVIMVQKHSLQTVQSRLFFGAAKESTYSNDCSFIKMLEKLKGFIDVNKIYIPSKVNIVKEGEELKGSHAKTQLKRIVNPGGPRQLPFRKRKQSCQPFTMYSKSSVNLIKQPDRQLRSFPSCAELNLSRLDRTNSITPCSPSSPLFGGDKNATFQGLSDNWGSKEYINQDSSISSIKVISLSPQKRKEDPIHPFPQQRPLRAQQMPLDRSQNCSNLMRAPLTSVQSTPVFYLSRPRHLKKQEVVDPPIRAPVKPVSQLNEPAKRANIRKYSQQLIKLKSADSLANKKFQASTICRNFFEPHPQEQQGQQLWQQKEEQIERQCQKQMIIREQPPYKADGGHASSSSLGIVASSPNNSSSTKQIGTSGEMQQNYRSLKMQDLAPHRKNNQSLIQHHLPDTHLKNMTVSYQFKRPEQQSDSQSEGGSPQPQWVNKISDLFSDTVSIKQLKGSIRFKGQEEVFEKEHLKDVKLDMLQKFGRSVTLHVEEDDQPVRAVSRHNQYKSMQLIEEELQEVKSYQDQERREDDITCKSIRSIRSRRQTQLDREREISFKDQFISFKDDFHLQADKADGGFNFQTQMYSIRAQRPF